MNQDKNTEPLEPAKRVVAAAPEQQVADPLDAIELSETETARALIEATAGTVGSSIPILGKMLEFAERVKQEIKEQKLVRLLKHYSAHFKSHDEAIARFSFLLGTRSGKVLFSKIIQILDSHTFEDESIELLANVLKEMSNEKIEEQFDEYIYVLGQIDRLTPQALIVLSKYEIWKAAPISGTTTTSKNTTCGDWDSQVTNFLAPPLGITDSHTLLRMMHSFKELESTGMVLLEGSRVKLGLIGAEVYGKIKK